MSQMFPVCVNKRNLPNKGKKIKVHPGSLERKILESSSTKQNKKRKHDDEIKEESDSDLDEEIKINVEQRDILAAPEEEAEWDAIKAKSTEKSKTKKRKGEIETLSVTSFVWDPSSIKQEAEDSSSDDEETEEVKKLISM